MVLVGEIRDLETAENAIQASLTGHLVFSTLHTNDAPSAYTRLVDMGVEPFLVASTVEAVMAQRLVRTLCKECREAFEPKRDDLPEDFPWDEYREARQAALPAQGLPRLPAAGLRRPARHFRTVRHDRRRAATGPRPREQLGNPQGRPQRRHANAARRTPGCKVLGGITTVDEVLRVTKGDRL